MWTIFTLKWIGSIRLSLFIEGRITPWLEHFFPLTFTLKVDSPHPMVRQSIAGPLLLLLGLPSHQSRERNGATAYTHSYRVFFLTGPTLKITSMEKRLSIRTGPTLKFTSMEKS